MTPEDALAYFFGRRHESYRYRLCARYMIKIVKVSRERKNLQ